MENSNNQYLWQLFTGENEQKALFTDFLNRVPSYCSGNRNLFEPSVSKYIYNKGFRPTYPNGKKFGVVLSHDVDELFFDKITTFKKLLKNYKNPEYIRQFFSRSISPEHELNSLLKIEKEFDFKATYFFLSLRPYESAFNYRLEEITDYFQKIKESGSEIALHGGFNASGYNEKINEEAKYFESVVQQKPKGFRNHYLCFDFASSWKELEKANFDYDATLGFSDCSGFRNGMCYPFQFHDATTNSFSKITEFPLIIMDTSLFVNMKLGVDSSLQLIFKLIDEVKAVDGVITILWHNSYYHFKDTYEILLKTLDYINQQNGWITSYADMLKHWNDNGFHQQMNEKLLELKSSF